MLCCGSSMEDALELVDVCDIGTEDVRAGFRLGGRHDEGDCRLSLSTLCEPWVARFLCLRSSSPRPFVERKHPRTSYTKPSQTAQTLNSLRLAKPNETLRHRQTHTQSASSPAVGERETDPTQRVIATQQQESSDGHAPAVAVAFGRNTRRKPAFRCCFRRTPAVPAPRRALLDAR